MNLEPMSRDQLYIGSQTGKQVCKSILLAMWLMLLAFAAAAQSPPPINDLKTAIEKARNQGDIEQLEQLTAELTALAAQRGDKRLATDALRIAAQNDISRNDYNAAIDKLLSVIDRYQTANASPSLAESYMYLGYAYYNLSEYPLALRYYRQAKVLDDATDNTPLGSSLENYIGLALGAIGDYEGAINAYQSALSRAIDKGDDEEISHAFYNLGGLNAKLGNHDKALDYYSSSLDIDEKLGMLQNIAFNNGLIAESLLALGDLSSATERAQQAVALFEQAGASEYACMYKLTLAKILLAGEQYSAAEEALKSIFNEAQDRFPALTLNTLVVATQHALQTKHFERALALAERGIGEARKAERLPLAEQFYEMKVSALEALKDYENAYFALTELMHVNHALNDERKLEAIAKVQAQTEIVRSQLQLELQTKQQALEQAELTRQLIVQNIVIGVILTSFTLLFILYKRYAQRIANQRLRDQVRLQTRELNEKNRQLVQAVKLVESESITDPLTGLKNRRYLQKFIQTDFSLSDRELADWLEGKASKPTESNLVIYMIDIDDFKLVNDTYGHNVGDEILREFASRLKEVFRQSDHIVRWGGEEYVAVARFIDRKAGSKLAKRVVHAINSQPFIITEELSLSITCSVGYVCYPCITDSFVPLSWEQALSIADAGVYIAKAAGKNTWFGVDNVRDAKCLMEEFNKDYLDALIAQKRVSINQP